MRKLSTQIGYIFQNVPNLGRNGMGAIFLYPICVECLHIPICKHSTQIGYKKISRLDFLEIVLKIIPNLCRMLAHTYMQAFYTDWVH